MPRLRATSVYADTLLCVHNEIVERRSVDAQELICPCIGLNECVSEIITSHLIPYQRLNVTGIKQGIRGRIYPPF